MMWRSNKKGKNNARRLIRTESAHLHNEMEARAYEEADVEKYRFVATLDLRTSSFCRPLDGKVFKVSERKVGKNYPPLHPWCRSTTVAADDEEWLNEMKRRAIDPKTGKSVLVPADMNYDEWYEKYVKPRYKVDNLDVWKLNRVSEQYERYKGILGVENVPKSLEKFIDLKYNNLNEYERLKQNVRDYKKWLKAEFPSEKSFNGHFEKHSTEFPNVSKERYREEAARLLGSPTNKNILGYDTEYRRVRYDVANNIFALGDNKRIRLTTMLKPKEGVSYYESDWKREFGDD
ncbi:minor capsid protein [Streptococcus respiraculi]|uniref:minor capsid protein n=1 Tax=Streptococcus respiraculi TaxID=2021971 RepID=UPI001F0C93FB|nr:minor capsid protein [Streptococcus respiraculi]